MTLPESDIKHHSPITIKVTGLENLYRKGTSTCEKERLACEYSDVTVVDSPLSDLIRWSCANGP